jgi:hypothetical protein
LLVRLYPILYFYPPPRHQAKLTPAERAAKKLAKFADDTTLESKVAIFRIGDFSAKQHQVPDFC